VLVGETNNGGEWIGTVVQFVAQDMYHRGERPTPSVNYKTVHASRGKVTRAAPVAAEFEHHRCHLVGVLPALEGECTGWVPGDPSPSRMDAMVWTLTELLLGDAVPRDLDLSRALSGLTQPSLTQRATQPPLGHFRDGGQTTGVPDDVRDRVRRQWNVNAYDDEDS
jgi:hypothetical protein